MGAINRIKRIKASAGHKVGTKAFLQVDDNDAREASRPICAIR